MNTEEDEWDKIIDADSNAFNIDFKILWRYKDLLFLFVKRDLLAFYKQTVLGPIWFFIQPLFTMVVYTFIFGNLAQLSTDGLPKPLFYLVGITFWTYFSGTLNLISNSLRTNQQLLGKIYFPRVILPLSMVISGLFRLVIQMSLLAVITIYFIIQGYDITPTINLLLLPILIVLLALQSLGIGLMVSGLTTKYRDVALLLNFGIQLFMYATPVVYPLGALPSPLNKFAYYNPLSPLFEGFRFSLFNVGSFQLTDLGISIAMSLAILIIGFLVFNKVEKDFVDTI